MKKVLTSLTALAIIAIMMGGGSANAAVVAIDSITGFSGGDSYTAGDFSQLTNGVGITKPDADDPSTWTNDGAAYGEEWYDDYLDATTSANGKLGWASFDLGSDTTDLESLFIFNGNYSGGQLSSQNINVYTAVSPTVALPTGVGQNDSVDYDFASGGWTTLTSATLTQVGTNADVIDLTGVTSAQYIGVEIMSAYTTDGRVGFDEVAITAIPEPASLVLLTLAGGAAFILRRRFRR